MSYESFRFTESVTLLAAVILGGMGTVPGAVLGASLLFVLPEKLREFSEYRLLLFGLALILIMRFRPQGLVPDRHRAGRARPRPRRRAPTRRHRRRPGRRCRHDRRQLPPRRRTGDGPILAASGVTMQFGGLRALGDVSFDLMEGQIIGLIGPNGAGKTTLFNCLTGLYAPTSGSVALRGERLPQDPALVTEKGIARTFQNIRLFPSMTAEENVLVGRHVRMKQGPLSSLLHGPKFRRSEAEARARTGELLDFVGLGAVPDELARNLPYGDQRRLEIARALATDPAVLLLDEPTAGMNAQETEGTRQLIFAIRDLGISVVVIEHDTKFIFTLCDRVLVLVQGELLVAGSPDEVRGDPRVVEAYLGRPARGGRGAAARGRRRRGPAAHEAPSTGGAHRRRDERVSFLQVRDLVVAYGAIQAVRGVSFDVEKGQIVSLIGSNGAGKTTTLRTVSGLLRAVSGEVLLDGEPIHRMPAHQILAKGIAHSPEGRKLFSRMTVEENLRLGAYTRSDEAGIREDIDHVYVAVPGAGGAAHEQGGPVLRRRAADAGDRPGADVAAGGAHARRAVDGPLADHDAEDLLDDQGAAGGGHHDPARRAERALGAGAVGPRLRHRPGAHDAVGHRPRAAGRSARAGGLPGRGRRQLTEASNRAGRAACPGGRGAPARPARTNQLRPERRPSRGAGTSRCRQVSRAVQVRRPWSSTSTISLVEVLRPTCTGRAVPVTQPSTAPRWCVQLSSNPTGERSGSRFSAASTDPSVSASTAFAPPCSRP